MTQVQIEMRERLGEELYARIKEPICACCLIREIRVKSPYRPLRSFFGWMTLGKF